MNGTILRHFGRERPLNYDSLAARVGCEAETGNSFFGEPVFVTNCVGTYDTTDEKFEVPLVACEFYGPAVKGEPVFPRLAVWSCWAAKKGVRVLQGGYSDVNRDTSGKLSALFNSGTYKSASGSFDRNGLLCLAVWDESDTIIVRRYDNEDGSKSEFTFSGMSPVLFDTSLVIRAEPSEGSIACFYIKSSDPTKLLVRFSSEDFATERVAIESVRVRIEKLLSMGIVDGAMELLYIDEYGRTGVLSTNQFSMLGDDSSSLSLSIASGAVGSNPDAVECSDPAVISVSVLSGLVSVSMVEPSEPIPTQDTNLSISILSGEIQ